MKLMATKLDNKQLPHVVVAEAESFSIGYSDWGCSIVNEEHETVLETDEYGFWQVPSEPDDVPWSYSSPEIVS